MNVNIEVIKCKYCGGSDMKRYGTYGDTQLWWCTQCERKQTGKDTLPKMRFPNDQIATALRLYYAGLSLDKVQEEFKEQYNTHVAISTLYEWLQEFTNEAVTRANEFKPKVGDEWIADETMLVIRGKTRTGKWVDRYYWLFDIIDSKTRFLLATHISIGRSIGDVQAVMSQAAKKAGKVPRVILTDKMRAYPDGIETIFNGQVRHIRTSPFVDVDHTNLIERFHGTLKDRTKVLRGFKSVDTAKQLLDGWLVYYNFFRDHESLNDKSPAESMGIELPFTSWLDIVKGTKGRVIKPEVQTMIEPSAHSPHDIQAKRKYYAEAKRRQRARQKQQQKPNSQSIIVVPRIK